MPRTPLYTLTWSHEHQRYGLSRQGRLEQQFRPEDQEVWQVWLETVTAFTFCGANENLKVTREPGSRGELCWYASSTKEHRTRKHALGPSASVTFALLEETATALGSAAASPAYASEQGQEEQNGAVHPLGSAAAHDVSPDLELLSTKLVPPVVPSRLLVRPRLLQRLDAAGLHGLTLLSASAGWGKTTLLSTWTARWTSPIAWLSLDEQENAPVRFWLSVLAALRTCLPGVGTTALAMLRSPQIPALSAILSSLLNELSEQQTPIFLVLDDYHLIDEQAIHDSLLFVLDHLPAPLHLVLSSRIDPPLRLSRWRARGQLLELRDADLRFQESEATQFLRQTMNLALDDEERTALAHRTEGWIAGLQLAAVSLMHHPDRAAFVRGFTGSHRYVLDYVQENILARLAPSMQDFVLSISILTRLSAPICQAVTTQEASQEMLETLERINLFLVPLDDERRWYRFHDLFREALLARLQATRPERVPLFHQRAARWYEEQGEVREAISHWLVARDFSSAIRLMEQNARRFWLDNDAEAMYRWAMELPDEVIREHTPLLLAMILYLIGNTAPTTDGQYTRAHKEAHSLMMRVETALRHQEDTIGQGIDPVQFSTSRTDNKQAPAADIILHRRLDLLHAWCAFRDAQVQNDYDQMSHIEQQVQQFTEEHDLTWQLIPIGISFIFRCTVQREGALLVPRLQEARTQARQSGDHFALIKIMHALALALLDAGQLRLTYQECLAGLDLLEQNAGSTQVAWHFSISIAIVLYQWNRLEEAKSVLSKLISEATTWQQSDLQAWGYLSLLVVELARGDLAAARQLLQEGEQLEQRPGDVLEPPWLTEMRVRWWLAQGNINELTAWAATVILPQERWAPFTYDVCLLLVRTSLARQQWTQAIETLERFRSQFDRPGNRFMSITFLSLYAVALHQAGKIKQARKAAAHLFSLTESEGYIRVYLEVGEPMRQLLQSFLLRPADSEYPSMNAVPHSYVITLLKAFEPQQQQEQQITVSSKLAEQPAPLPDTIDPSLIEPLSPQEQRVLQSICAGRSNREIADELVVSINTVKAHVKKIYSKLQVRNRIQACHVAQALRQFFGKTFAAGKPQSTS